MAGPLRKPRSSISSIGPRFHIRHDDRVFIAGQTGSGKTYLADGLLRAVRRVVILDPKCQFRSRFGGYKYTDKLTKDDRQVIQVPPHKGEYQRWDAILHELWYRGDTIVYVDEVNMISKQRPALDGLALCIRTGRSRGVGVWSGTQRPMDIPNICFTEAEHHFVFRLGYEGDRKKVTKFTTDAIGAELARLRGHDYLYYDQRANRAFRLVVND